MKRFATTVIVAGCLTSLTLSASIPRDQLYPAGSVGLDELPPIPDNIVDITEDQIGSSSLEKRAKRCTKTSDCYSEPNPWASHDYCNPSTKTCTWLCNSGYTKYGDKCVKNQNPPPPTTTTRTTTTTKPKPTSYPYNLFDGQIKSNNVTQWKAQSLGTNTGAIASWYKTESSIDSTNGRSWCEFPYTDNTPGFAPSYRMMVQVNFGGRNDAAASAYCGLEAEFTTPDGRKATLFLVDAFADPWVLTPTSVDVIKGSFPLLYGRTTDDKNDVVQNVSWRFTGRRLYRAKFKGLGWPSALEGPWPQPK
ncbi:hypothetical protein OIO90_005878 [Microbotryomycetes sp. JL221]|nr:hypothetical protein OIO90_005878 [Microbotryomycetes sp. JL221]